MSILLKRSMKEKDNAFNVKKLEKDCKWMTRLRAPSTVCALSHSAKLPAFIIFIQVEALTLSESSITRKSAILKYLSTTIL